MKNLIIFFCLIGSLITHAQSLQHFEAVKKTRSYKFKLNKPIQISYLEDNNIHEVSGRLNELKAEGIYILPLYKDNVTRKFIALDSIISITKLLEQNRKPIGVFGNLPISIKKGWRFVIH
ncbi:MAG: hypothetical protein H0W75_01090 [Chitinophagaceae bacterium]|nr:hypothetical protein [Chitinophagaceae bacterium]